MCFCIYLLINYRIDGPNIIVPKYPNVNLKWEDIFYQNLMSMIKTTNAEEVHMYFILVPLNPIYSYLTHKKKPS